MVSKTNFKGIGMLLLNELILIVVVVSTMLRSIGNSYLSNAINQIYHCIIRVFFVIMRSFIGNSVKGVFFPII